MNLHVLTTPSRYNLSTFLTFSFLSSPFESTIITISHINYDPKYFILNSSCLESNPNPSAIITSQFKLQQNMKNKKSSRTIKFTWHHTSTVNSFQSLSHINYDPKYLILNSSCLEPNPNPSAIIIIHLNPRRTIKSAHRHTSTVNSSFPSKRPLKLSQHQIWEIDI